MDLGDNSNEQVIEYIQSISKKYFIAPEISVFDDRKEGCAVSIRNAIPMYDCDITIGITWGMDFVIFYNFDLKQFYSDELDDSVFKLLNDFHVKAGTRYVAKIEKDFITNMNYKLKIYYCHHSISSIEQLKNDIETALALTHKEYFDIIKRIVDNANSGRRY